LEEARPAPSFLLKEFGYRCLLLSLDKVPEYSDVINLIQTDESERSGRGVPLITDRYGKDALAFRENAIVISIPFRRISVIDPSNTGAADVLHGHRKDRDTKQYPLPEEEGLYHKSRLPQNRLLGSKAT